MDTEAPDLPDGPGTTQALGPNEGRSSSPTEGVTDPSTRLLGRILAGRYLLERVIGRGGMGIVFEARHVRVGRQVAVKVLRPDLAQVAEATQRFHREAQAAAAVGSEHIVEVFDYGYGDDGEAFIVMELLEGEDLGALVRRTGSLPTGRAVGIARQIAGALQSAHDKGIIHRDLKSENVFILSRDGADFVKVVDFGISKVRESGPGRGPITESGTILGTPHYMAPEQGVGHVEPDHRIDVYALGCLFYEMLTGELPFTGRTVVEVMYKHVHEPVRLPSRVRPDAGIPPSLDAVVLRALAKDRDKRFPTAAALAAALPDASALPGGERAWRSTGATPPPPLRRWRKRAMAAGLLAAFGLGLVVAAHPRPAMRTEGRTAPRTPLPHPAPVPSLRATVPVPVVVRERPVVADAGGGPGLHAAVPPIVQPAVLALLVRPDGAVIRVDGHVVGTGVFTGRFAGGTVHRVGAQATGYLSREEEVTLDGDRALHWTLVRLSPARTLSHPNATATDAGTAHPGTPPGGSHSPPDHSPPDHPPPVGPPDGLHGNPFT